MYIYVYTYLYMSIYTIYICIYTLYACLHNTGALKIQKVSKFTQPFKRIAFLLQSQKNFANIFEIVTRLVEIK